MNITDNPDEIFDVVDENDNVIGRATRKECNSNPDLIHRAVFILVYNDKDEILWQKRSLTKDAAPGKWVTSVSGHVDAGEDYVDATIREVMEEIGIDVEAEFLGKFLFRYQIPIKLTFHFLINFSKSNASSIFINSHNTCV